MAMRILVVDDEPVVCTVLASILEKKGYEVATEDSGKSALVFLEHHPVDLLLSDICMDGMNGVELMRQARRLYPNLAVIMVTGYASIDTAVEAMQLGAFDYIRKPFKHDELLRCVQRAIEYEQTAAENRRHGNEFVAEIHFSQLIGETPSMLELYREIQERARGTSPCFLVGESGSGKKSVARAIHQQGPQRNQNFIMQNGALHPADRLEGLLFASSESAIPADYEQARGGILCIEHLSLLAESLQQRLAEALNQDREKPPQQRVKLLALELVAPQKFCHPANLHPKLAACFPQPPLFLPPLRERRDDLSLLAAFFLQQIQQQTARECYLAPETAQLLHDYSWPGNVRELRNTIIRAAENCQGDAILPKDLPSPFQQYDSEEPILPSLLNESREKGRSLRKFLQEKEREYIEYVLRLADGNKQKAAKMLGISVATFYRKWEKHHDTAPS